MYIPAARDRVEIVGRAGVFFVLALDQETRCAHVISLDDLAQSAEDVAFSTMRLHTGIPVAMEDAQA